MESDRFHFIERECQITPPQETTLLSVAAPFVREQPFTDGDDDTWPVSSDDNDDAFDNTEHITFCSPPPSPQPDDVTAVGTNAVVDGLSEGLVFGIERKRPREELLSQSPSTTAKKLKSCDDGANAAAFGGDTVELDECEVVLDKGKEKVYDTEEVNNVSDDEEEEDDDDVVDTELIEKNSKEESSGDIMKCLREALRVLSEMNKGKGEDGKVDFLETAKRRGLTFPEPRWKRLN